MGAATLTWDEEAVRERIAAVVADAERALRPDLSWPNHPADEAGETPWSTLYLGAAGVAWALARLGSTIDVAAVVDAAVERCRSDADPEEEPRSLLMGEAGVLLVARAVGAASYDEPRLRELVRANAENPTWELMWGSPGSLLIALHCGFDDLYDELAPILVEACDEDGVWTQDMYGSTVRYLGPVHGFVGNLHVLRRHLGPDEARRRARAVLETRAARDGGVVNWHPLADDDRDAGRVQWCHGAPGIVCTLGDLLPEDLLLGAAELVWRTGPLQKGAGLCHGTAGNGYALLRTYELTRDERWLDRGRSFALHALDQAGGRYTLFTGDVGAALLAQACLDEDARFPVMDVV